MAERQEDWQAVKYDEPSAKSGGITERLRVPGGWLYRTVFVRIDQDAEDVLQEVQATAMVFVPEVKE